MRTLRPLDAAAVAAVLVMSLLSAVPLLARPENATVVVKTEDDEFRLPLGENTVRGISSNGHNLTLEIRDGEARVISADCPDHLALELDLVAVLLRSGMDAEARQFVAERFDWLTDYRLKLLKLDDDARFYISLVDVILGICAEQRAESESGQTA